MKNKNPEPGFSRPWLSLLGIAAMAAALTACGGGGGGGGGEADPGPIPVVAPSATSVAAVATYLDTAPTSGFRLVLRNPPPDGAYVDIHYTGTGVQNVDFTETVPGTAEFTVSFRPPVEVNVGTAIDTITLTVCEDPRCSRQIEGSPVRVTASYTITSPTSASISTGALSAEGSTVHPRPIALKATVNLTGAGATPPTISPVFPASLVSSVTSTSVSPSTMELTIALNLANAMSVGTHTGNVAVRVCYDPDCQRQVNGSPFPIALTYKVTSDPMAEPGLEPVPVRNRISLPHDIVDAEFSKSLGAIVMVSSWPQNSLYLYDVATGTEREVDLYSRPIAVSVAPDGLKAVVGHNAMISHVDLASVGDPSAPLPVTIDVSTHVRDVVLDGRGHAHVFPAGASWESVHSVDLATGTETLDSTGRLYGGALARLHPSGDYIYTADNGLTPGDIAKYDIRSGTAERLYDSPYHGDFALCGNVWMKEDGMTLYTGCGNAFRSSTAPALDMTYSGQLDLSDAIFGFQIYSLSQSDATDEIALIEGDWLDCEPSRNPLYCFTHLGIFGSTSLGRVALYSIPPLTVAGGVYVQRGLFVFHTDGGAGIVMLSRLPGIPDPAAEYYLTTLP